MPALHQFVPTLEPGATGAHAIEIHRTVRELGWDSELFWYDAKAPYDRLGRPYRDYGTTFPAGPDDVLLYHVAVGSVIADWLVEQPQRLVLYYHNLTPPEFYDRWEPFAAYACTWGRTQVRRLVDRAYFAMCASSFSQSELLDMGYLDTAVVPILLDTSQFEGDVDDGEFDRLQRRKDAGGADWLFVGRLSPNKAQEDLIKSLAAYRRAYDPDARLALIGGSSSEAYSTALVKLAEKLGLTEAVAVPGLTGHVPPPVLHAHYRNADVFVCVSEHEGFLVPLLEAWHHRLPVVAYSAGAVPQTLGDGGVLLLDKSPLVVAAAVHRVLSDGDLREALVEAGSRRLQELSLERARARFLEVIAKVMP